MRPTASPHLPALIACAGIAALALALVHAVARHGATVAAWAL